MATARGRSRSTRGRLADLCVVGGELTPAKRELLTGREFGLPVERKYPINDLSHARNAKARAAHQLNQGNLTASEYRQIVSRADRVIRACAPNNNPGNPNGTRMETETENPMSPAAKVALWIGGGLLGAGAVVGIAYAVKKSKNEAPEEDAPKIPVPIPIPIPAAPAGPEGAAPSPEPAEPAAAGVVPGLEMLAHGIRVDVPKSQITVVNPGAWVAWAGPEVASINIEQWTAAEVMDNLFRKAFPGLPADLSTLLGWTINGQPYGDVVARGQTFIDQMVAGELTVPKNFPGHKAFAQIMAGQEYTPLRLLVPAPKNPDTGWELYQRDKAGVGLHHFLVKFVKIQQPGLGQAMFSWQWWTWGPGVTDLGPANALETGGKAQKPDAIQTAKDSIDGYVIVQAVGGAPGNPHAGAPGNPHGVSPMLASAGVEPTKLEFTPRYFSGNKCYLPDGTEYTCPAPVAGAEAGSAAIKALGIGELPPRPALPKKPELAAPGLVCPPGYRWQWNPSAPGVPPTLGACVPEPIPPEPIPPGLPKPAFP